MIPRMCGGVSILIYTIDIHHEDSPHVRGCIVTIDLRELAQVGFLACAGLYPYFCMLIVFLWRIPRMCGVVSKGFPDCSQYSTDSPHVRGCIAQTQAVHTPERESPHVRGCIEKWEVHIPFPEDSLHVRGCIERLMFPGKADIQTHRRCRVSSKRHGVSHFQKGR